MDPEESDRALGSNKVGSKMKNKEHYKNRERSDDNKWFGLDSQTNNDKRITLSRSTDESIDTITPDLIEQMKDYDLHLNLDDMDQLTYTESDYTTEEEDGDEQDDADRKEDSYMEKESGKRNSNDNGGTTPFQEASVENHAIKPVENGALVLLGNDDESDINSDEEADIMKEIRDEIQKKVREEMKDELGVYKTKLAALEQGHIDGGDKNSTSDNKDDNLEHLEPKIREGILKMRKLDRILAKRIKREKEVKRERILLERRIKQELEGLQPEGREETRDVKTNTQKYLALTLPPRHNEGVDVESRTVTPVFQTQLDDMDFTHKNKDNKDTDDNTSGRKSEGDQNKSRSSSKNSGEVNEKRRKKKDFIKRNKELAAEAAEVIALTDEEKKRLKDLLHDVENIPDLPEMDDDFNKIDDNPFQVAIQPGEGFAPDNKENCSLSEIDSRLRELLPPEDFEKLKSGANSASDIQQPFFTRTLKSSIDFHNYGERALIETKEEREMQAKLEQIEQQLALLKNPEEVEIADTPRLSDYDLQYLLDDAVRSLSRSSFANTDSMTESVPSTPSTTRSSIYENPPVLPNDVLQKLLSEAHFPLSKHLPTLNEGGNEEEEQVQPIDAETWKTIAQENTGSSSHLLKEPLLSRTPSQNSLFSSKSYSENQEVYSSCEVDDEAKDKEREKYFLPKINRNPNLVSHGVYNNAPNIQSFRSNSQNSRIGSGLSDPQLSMDIVSLSGDFDTPTPTPHPPSVRSNSRNSRIGSEAS